MSKKKQQLDINAINSHKFERYLRFLVNDIILFDQAACTSPHTVFFEKTEKSIDDISKSIAEEFRRIAKKFPKTGIDQYIMTKIINKRAEYALDMSKMVLCSKENDWTILINDKIRVYSLIYLSLLTACFSCLNNFLIFF